ncbi:unnamed protein product [Rangifer tarandus platyrhynchus]|uniref:Uncharacterized protein n=2 Tax=Rangifer tarandus platyrhynchus TaxID=3082113 RepID=A0ABN9A330_RANTA|nr:unnamed protein product [Rangifer tarandus platyrhynchus]
MLSAHLCGLPSQTTRPGKGRVSRYCLVTPLCPDSLRPHRLVAPPGSSVHEILQATILEWVVISSSIKKFLSAFLKHLMKSSESTFFGQPHIGHEFQVFPARKLRHSCQLFCGAVCNGAIPLLLKAQPPSLHDPSSHRC